MALEVAGIVEGKQVLARADGNREAAGDRSQPGVIERRDRLLDPGEVIVRQCGQPFGRCLRIPDAVGIERQRVRPGNVQCGFDTGQIGRQRRAADLDLEGAEAARVRFGEGLAQRPGIGGVRAVVAAGAVNGDRWRPGRAEIVGDCAPGRLAALAGPQVPQRHIEHPDRAGALAMTARLFVRHHGAPGRGGIDQAVGVQQVTGFRIEQPRDEAFAQQRAMAVAADRIEAEAAQRAAVRFHDDRAGGHRIVGDAGVAQTGRERDRPLADRADFHGRPASPGPTVRPGSSRARKYRRRCRDCPCIWFRHRRRDNCPATA